MAITRLHEIWDMLHEKFPRDEWVYIQTIYEIVESNIQLRSDDFLPSAPSSSEPKWMRNVRNVLQQRKSTGDIAWNRNGSYMIPTTEISITSDGIAAPSKMEYRISEERFKKIKESREAIGHAGEDWVVSYEQNYLTNHGMSNLADRITRVSETNVGAGYDILSFALDRSEKYIEVKTTALSKMEFFISANELEIAKQLDGSYWIYLVSEIYGVPKLVTIQDPTTEIDKKIFLTPIHFQARVNA